MNNCRKEILRFIHEYENFRKKNPLKETKEIIDFGTEIFENNSYYHIDWSLKYGHAQFVGDLPILYSITIDLNDFLGNYIYACNDSAGIVISIESKYFVPCKKVLFHLLDWTVRNFNNIEPKDIHRNANIAIREILKNYP